MRKTHDTQVVAIAKHLFANFEEIFENFFSVIAMR
jgi:hypothetical protein